jgi:hypothetical protein
MPIQCYNPPAASLQALQEAVQTMPKAYDQVAEMVREIVRDLPHHWPHPVYRVGLGEAASATGWAMPELIGWRYLARSESDRYYAVEVQVDGTQHQFAELDKGPYIDGVYHLVTDEGLWQKPGTRDFKLAVLRLNALGIFAVWLQANQPEQSLFIPLPPKPRWLTQQQYTTNEFQAALREQAKEKLATALSDA